MAIYFSNTLALQRAAPKDAPELLELEEMEMRELMREYEMGGEKTAVLFDADVSQIYKSEYAKGTPELRRFLASYSLRRSPPPALRSVSEFSCYYYLLSNPEANGRGVTLADRSQIDVWVEGKTATGFVKSTTSHKPGDNGEFVLRLESPLKAIEGSRTLLLRNGVTVGVGVVKSVQR